jgi:DNA-binding MarR family transcriptional regulator
MGNGDAMSPLSATPGFERADLVIAALDLLDEKGFERLSVRRLAERIGADPVLIRRHFLRRRDLIDAMTAAMLKSVAKPIAADAGWQDALRHRATMARHAMLSRRDGAFLIARATAPFCARERRCVDALAAAGFARDGAENAVELIDRFTLGWVISEQAAPPASSDANTRFAARIDTILHALAPRDLPTAPAAEKVSTPYILQLRLWKVLHAARESADIAYARTIKLIELDRRILLLLESHGDLVPAEVSASMGVDKAQVSRSVKRLEELGLILRDGVRSPLALTPEGRTLTERMMRLAELRNRELTFSISDDQLVQFFAVVEQLMARAVLLLDQERKLMAAGRTETSLGYDDLAIVGDPANGGGIVVERSRILPPLITLSSYAMRSAALAFKRLTGLSNFESWVLNEIARTPPMEWSALVHSVNRDQSQAGRTVNRLIDMGLIVRDGPPARRHGTFSPTPEGARLHGLLEHAGRQRSEFLIQNLAPRQLDAFFTVFEIIAHNADAQLNRERALDEVERGD